MHHPSEVFICNYFIKAYDFAMSYRPVSTFKNRKILPAYIGNFLEKIMSPIISCIIKNTNLQKKLIDKIIKLLKKCDICISTAVIYHTLSFSVTLKDQSILFIKNQTAEIR